MTRLSVLHPASHPTWLEWWVFVTVIGLLCLSLATLLGAAALLGEFIAIRTGVADPATGRAAGPIVVAVLYLHAAWW
jgi:hypothetical protein